MYYVSSQKLVIGKRKSKYYLILSDITIKLQCNESITTSHENICVISKGVDVQEYKLDYGDAMRSLVAMKCRKMTKCWTCFCTKFSVVVIESEYETETWNELWKAVKELYDSRTPKHPKTINENKKNFQELMDIYICRASTRRLLDKLRIVRLITRNPLDTSDLRVIRRVTRNHLVTSTPIFYCPEVLCIINYFCVNPECPLVLDIRGSGFQNPPRRTKRVSFKSHRSDTT